MYENILREIFAQNGAGDNVSQAAHLQSFKDSARVLWNAYQKSTVTVDYSTPASQEAYLLRYFVPYSHLLPKVLLKLEDEGIGLSNAGGLLTACFFGCGPGPELAGLIRHLKQKRERPEMLIATMLDVASASWQYGRAIVENAILAHAWDSGLLEIDPVATDISSMASPPQYDALQRRIEAADLVVFQNCLNELNTAALADVARNLRELLNMAKNNATFVLIERNGYDATAKMLLGLSQWAQQNGFRVINRLSAPAKLECRTMLNKIPRAVTEHLFVRKRDDSDILPDAHGLVLAASVTYRWLALSKPARTPA